MKKTLLFLFVLSFGISHLLSGQNKYAVLIDTVINSLPQPGRDDRPMWTDLVTEQPDGYVIDGEGNVEISTAEGLAWLISVVNGLNGCQADDFEGRRVTLTNDVDLSEGEWVSIGDATTNPPIAFRGSFDGNNHKIISLFIHDKTYFKSYLGMFGYLSQAVVENILFEDGRVYGGSYCGAIAGWSDNNSIIDNCVVKLASGSDFYAGGIAGRNRNSRVSNCCYISTIFGNWDSYSGGIAGLNEADGEDAIIENCYYDSQTDESLNSEFTGGIVGYNQVIEGGNAIVRNCYADVHHTFVNRMGGIVGRNQGGEIANCYFHSVYSNVNAIGYGEHNGTDCSRFSYETGSSATLETPILIGNVLSYTLLDALNSWITLQNNPSDYTSWCEESALPLFCHQAIAVTEQNEEAVLLYPNPASHTCEIVGAQLSHVVISDLKGQTIIKAEGPSIHVDVSQWNSGLYFVQMVVSDGLVITKKMIVQH